MSLPVGLACRRRMSSSRAGVLVVLAAACGLPAPVPVQPSRLSTTGPPQCCGTPALHGPEGTKLHSGLIDAGTNDAGCQTTWNTDLAVASDERAAAAWEPLCSGPAECVPIVTSGHPGPSYTPPYSTCDAIPAGTCSGQFTCACLLPLLRSYTLWPPSKWNCSWFCVDLADGGVQFRCSLP
jgi:hypothetical protein